MIFEAFNSHALTSEGVIYFGSRLSTLIFSPVIFGSIRNFFIMSVNNLKPFICNFLSECPESKCQKKQIYMLP